MSLLRLRRQLNQVAAAVARPADAAPRALAAPDDDAKEVATEAAEAFAQVAKAYQEQLGLSPDEARSRADGDKADRERIRTAPPKQVSWGDLNVLGRHDPAAALARWGDVKEAARRELRSGHRAARALDCAPVTSWTRAKFLALRDELAEGWRPQNAPEQHLMDLMAQYQTLIWHWQESVRSYSALADLSRAETRPNGKSTEVPRLSYAEALDRAVGLVERFQRLYIQALNALLALRRRPTLVVRQAGQINIAQQQVNLG